MKKIVLGGLEGKMGSFLFESLKKVEGLHVVAGVGEKEKIAQEIPIYNDLNQLVAEVDFDIYIDFTVYEFAKFAAEFMIKANIPIIIGTTGFKDEDIEYLRNCGGRGIIAPNFSMGAILLNRFARICTQYFENFAICEYHHPSKQDNPSGTALYLAKTIDQHLNREAGMTPVHGIRLPGVLATHHLIVSDETQKIEVVHQSNSRHSFKQGIILAISKVDELDELIYGLEPIIKG